MDGFGQIQPYFLFVIVIHILEIPHSPSLSLCPYLYFAPGWGWREYLSSHDRQACYLNDQAWMTSFQRHKSPKYLKVLWLEVIHPKGETTYHIICDKTGGAKWEKYMYCHLAEINLYWFVCLSKHNNNLPLFQSKKNFHFPDTESFGLRCEIRQQATVPTDTPA